MLDYGIYLLFRIALALLSLVPLPALFVCGQLAGLLCWMLLPNYRRLALRNAEIAFHNEKTPRELRRLVRRHFSRLGANLLCSAKMPTMRLERLASRVTVENVEPAE